MAIHTIVSFQTIVTPDPSNPGMIQVHVQPGAHALFGGGVVMDLAIAVDPVTATALQKQGTPVPSPVVVKALVDTGCTITSVDQSVVKKLSLVTRGYQKTLTPNGPMQVSTHAVALSFPGTRLNSKSLFVVQAVNLAGQPIQALIGRDLMTSWNIHYNGAFGVVSISD